MSGRISFLFFGRGVGMVIALHFFSPLGHNWLQCCLSFGSTA